VSTPDPLMAEVAWVAHETVALIGSTDEQRRAAFMARKRALLEALDAAEAAAHQGDQ
jgi:hypothetical protein